jgi:hypothetical protein
LKVVDLRHSHAKRCFQQAQQRSGPEVEKSALDFEPAIELSEDCIKEGEYSYNISSNEEKHIA